MKLFYILFYYIILGTKYCIFVCICVLGKKYCIFICI